MPVPLHVYDQHYSKGGLQCTSVVQVPWQPTVAPVPTTVSRPLGGFVPPAIFYPLPPLRVKCKRGPDAQTLPAAQPMYATHS